MDPYRLVSLLAPPRCVACATATVAGHDLCARCESALASARPSGSVLAIGARSLEVLWACDYSGVGRDLVHALKFARRISAAAPIAAAMAALVSPPSALVPVPAAPWRRRLRGFDPAEEIAFALGRQTGLEVVRCLARAGGRRQVGRSRADRLRDPPQVRLVGTAPDNAVLVDDVFTTGATLAACARSLRAGSVRAITFAHGRSI